MANSSNVIGEIAARVAQFLRRWVQSPSIDYDTIVATTFESKWARLHLPIITTVRLEPSDDQPEQYEKVTTHTLYAAYSPSILDGKVVKCQRGCREPLIAKELGTVVRLTCTNCKSRCYLDLRKTGRNTALGVHDLAAVIFPEVQQQVDWEDSTDPDTPHVSSCTDDEEATTMDPEHGENVEMDLGSVLGEDDTANQERPVLLSATKPPKRSSRREPSPSHTPPTMSGSSSSPAQLDIEHPATQPTPSSSHLQHRRGRQSPPSKLPAYLTRFMENPVKVVPLQRAKSAPVRPHDDHELQGKTPATEEKTAKKKSRKTLAKQ